jgi:hypothetical protein
MIAAEISRNGGVVKWPVLICTKRLWDLHEPKEHRNLQNAFKRFVDPNGFEGAHGAVPDTIACGRVLKSQIKLFGLEGKSWTDYDPDQRQWWGPTDHFIVKNGVLVMNFGKNKGTPVHLVEKSFWRWLVEKDFPEYVKRLADYLVHIAKPNITGEELLAWANEKVVF